MSSRLGKTTVSILISKTSSQGSSMSNDPHYNQRIAVSVWAGKTGSANSEKRTLTYYHFWDHPRQWTHLDGLLTRLAPVSVIHVASVDALSGSNKDAAKAGNGSRASTAALLKTMQVQKVMDKLCKMLQGRTDLCEQTVQDARGEAASSLVHVHKGGMPTVDPSRLKSILQQLLATEEEDGNLLNQASLRVAGNVELVHHSLIARGLVLYLSQAGVCQPNDTALDDDHLHRYEIDVGVLDSHLVLDRTAAAAIHLWPPPNAGQAVVTGGRADTNSLAGLLGSHVKTCMGKRLLETWLRQPLVQLEPLQQRQAAVTALVQNTIERDAIRNEGLQPFVGKDLVKVALLLSTYEESLSGDDTNQADDEDDEGQGMDSNTTSRVSTTGSTRKALRSLYDLYLIASQKIPALVEHLGALPCLRDAEQQPDDAADNSLLSQILAGLTEAMIEFDKAVLLVEKVLDLDLAPREMQIKHEYKPELQDIHAELEQVHAELDDCLADMNETWAQASGNTNMNAVRLDTWGEDGTWQFRLPNTNDAKILENQLGSTVKVHRLLKNGVYFSTKELRQLSTKKQDLVAQFDRESRQIGLQVMQIAATYAPVVERASEHVASLDVLVGLAHMAAYSPHGYCCPVLTDGEEDGKGIVLEKARHPCVELQENVEYIPNDISLVFGQSSFCLVTGPNMGGKSTYIRALGAIVTLAQIGSYVPCTAAQINICHHILARVGAGDLQERGISTFMAEMLESSGILRTASKRSLIIIDELGRGTSTFDGMGLARSISEYIIQEIGCMTVFATHFHELTKMQDTHRVVQNRHVTAKRGDGGLNFLYEVRPGPCLESFGIQVAEMANVPARVIQDAKRKAKQLERFEYRPADKSRDEETTNDGIDGDENVTPEEESAAVDFCHRFRRLDIPGILQNHKDYPTDDDKKAAIQRLLQVG